MISEYDGLIIQTKIQNMKKKIVSSKILEKKKSTNFKEARVTKKRFKTFETQNIYIYIIQR